MSTTYTGRGNVLVEAKSALAGAERLYTREEVEAALDRIAAQVTARLAKSDPLVVCVLLGGLVPFGKLLARLDFPLEVDYIHATRYRGALTGEALRWISGPVSSVSGRIVLIVDDILDEGTTLAAIEQRFLAAGAAAVFKAVLLEKERPRTQPVAADFVGLRVPNRYVFGYGMDYKGYWRNLAAIYAVSDEG